MNDGFETVEFATTVKTKSRRAMKRDG